MSAFLDFRVAWETYVAGMLTFGRSTFGGGDAFSSAYAASFDGVHDDLSDLVQDAQWQRGRSDLSTKVLAGRGSVTVLDENGTFNPLNDASPLAGMLVPLRPCYLTIADSSGEM